jgi:hypothetical protein
MPARSCVSSGIDTANAMFMDSLVADALVCGEWLAVRPRQSLGLKWMGSGL